jgi:hypothetical protein
MLMFHSDCDGAWSPEQAAALDNELEKIGEELSHLPPSDLKAGSWQHEVATSLGLRPKNLYEFFFDVDGEPLIERLRDLVRASQARGKDILFQ